MTTTMRHRSVALAGFLLLILLVLAVGAENGRAMRPSDSSLSGGAATVASLAQAQAQVALVKQTQLDRGQAAVAPAPGLPSSPAGGTSTTAWVVLAVALAAAAIVVWVVMRRRSASRLAVSGDSGDAFCTLHPQDARCPAV